MRRARIHVIGVSPEGAGSLSPAARRLVKRAQVLFGGERLLGMFPDIAADKIAIKNNLAEVLRLVKASLGVKRMVVLASGDPGFFGITRYLTDKLGKDAIEILPNISSMQLAFARIKESWDDARLVSAHSQSLEDVIEEMRGGAKVAILTDDHNTPGVIARLLLERGFDDCRAYVCQDLGSAQERIIRTTLKRLPSRSFSPLCIMILVRDAATVGKAAPSLGIPEAQFAQLAGRSLITKLEVRAVSLARLGLDERSVVWDIGAGSGAVSIEAARLARLGQVFAIERDSKSIANIRQNVKKFAGHNITVVEAAVPEGLEALPNPAAVFIGAAGAD